MIEQTLELNPDLQQFLFVRGFLVTTNTRLSPEGFPLYGSWRRTAIGELEVWTHPSTGFHLVDRAGVTAFLLGHAYNPFTMEIDEQKILERLLDHYGAADFSDTLDELTGVFTLGIVRDEVITFLTDPSGMQSACYGLVEGDFYLSSHPQLVADFCGLKMDDFVVRLIQYKWYPRVMGAYLPADLTPYAELRRVVPNNEFVFDYKRRTLAHRRFYPIKSLRMCSSDEEYRTAIISAAEILKRSLDLVTRKWSEPWVSLTGGIDSNTTFAAATGHYDQLKAFSYLSAPKEAPDCEAAEVIAARFNVSWQLYRIPDDSNSLDRFDEKVAIIRHNNSYIGKERANELRKRILLQAECPADVEVKSWVSETIRAYWYKHFGRKKMPELSPKLFRNLYKIFLADRRLAHEIDQLFAAYIESFDYATIPDEYPPADMFFNEVTWGSWGGRNISEMKFCFDITTIYNNRRFLDLMFTVPLEKRISDQHHIDMKRYLNSELHSMNIRIVNAKETRLRSFALNMVFTANSLLP